MPPFVRPELLLWGLPILALPVLIHLINMLRRRKIPWAAMEFLLASQKKNTTWIRLKELLLLLLRLAAVAGVVAALAQPSLRSQLAALLGGAQTHHIVILDDSLSMGETNGEGGPFPQAQAVVQRIVERVGEDSGLTRFSLLRFSQAERADGPNLDFREERVSPQLAADVATALKALAPSELAVGPQAALKAVQQLFGESLDETRMIYLVSDFRSEDWDQAEDVARSLGALSGPQSQLHLVRCVQEGQPNLALTRLVPRRGIRAAGVPLLMEATVQNFGGARATNVTVSLQEGGVSRPALTLEEIPPGGSATQAFPVFFPAAGEQTIRASLAADALNADNQRFAVLNLPSQVPVLLVDGNPAGLGGQFLLLPLNPGGTVKTGLSVTVVEPSDLATAELGKYELLLLNDVGRLNDRAIERVEEFVRAGGGIAFFLGENCAGQTAFYSDQLYQEGEGVFPAPLASDLQLIVDRLDKAPDLEISEHPLLSIFSGERNSFLAAVTVDRFFATPRDWTPAEGSSVRVVAKLRNGLPLILEQQFGEGRVVAVLTSAAPDWNNWARNPSFVVFALELASWLAPSAAAPAELTVGRPIVVNLDPQAVEPQVRVQLPGEPEAEPPAALDALPATDRAGVYRVELTRLDGSKQSEQQAFNVDVRESDLAVADGEQIAALLSGVPYQFRSAADFQPQSQNLGGSSVTQWILLLLLLILLGEQLLAFFCSYHAPVLEPAR